MSMFVTVACIAAGSLLTALAALGIVRMPDLFTRMQTATKASTLGVACIMLAAVVHSGDLATGARAALITGFLFFTAPVAAHAIGRAAYFDGVVLWENTQFDELRECYERDTHRLHSEPAGGESGPEDERRGG
jgi:multicomponent Na+:H+ antiporter subunit G